MSAQGELQEKSEEERSEAEASPPPHSSTFPREQEVKSR